MFLKRERSKTFSLHRQAGFLKKEILFRRSYPIKAKSRRCTISAPLAQQGDARNVLQRRLAKGKVTHDTQDLL
jgi:hypothetical protein